MGFFSSIGNFFKSTVGKVLGTVGAVVAAPFTGGASLLTIPAILGAGSKSPSDEETSKIKSLFNKSKDKLATPYEVQRISLPKKVEPVTTIQTEKVVVKENDIQTKTITTPKKTDVTLYGYYSTINKITIPVDNDLDNVIVVPKTFFPYIVEFDNHPPSKGIRYISQFVYDSLQIEWGSNLGKVLHTLEKDLTQYPYIKFNWNTFVDKYNNFEADKLKRDGGILYGFTISPIFLLQWIDGPEPTTLLDYSWVIPAPVKTIGEQNPTQGEAPRISATVSYDEKRADKLTKIIETVSKVGATFAIAKAALGGIKSIYGNTKDAIKNLSDTAAKLGDKFKDMKAALSKDAINGKISDVKNLIKTKLPTPKNLKNLYADFKLNIMAKRDLRRDLRLQKKKQKREAKDKGLKTKFSLKNFNLPDLPQVPNIPSVPTLPKKINLANLNTLPGLGKLPNVGGLIAQGKGIVSGVGAINLKDPMSLLNAPANILNSVNTLADSTATTLGSTAQSIIQPSLDAKNAREAQQKQFDEQINQMQQQAKNDLQKFLASQPKPTISKGT